MVVATHSSAHPSGKVRRIVRPLLPVVVAALLLGLAPFAAAQPDQLAGVNGTMITVPSVITDDWVTQLKNDLDRVIKADETKRKRNAQNPFKVVFDFNAKGNPNSSTNAFPCLHLREVIQNLRTRGVYTVAYVRDEVSKHTVLPVLACNELVMKEQAPDSKKGGGRIGD